TSCSPTMSRGRARGGASRTRSSCSVWAADWTYRAAGHRMPSDEPHRVLQAGADVEELVAADVTGAGNALTQHHRQRTAPRNHDRNAADGAQRRHRLREIVVREHDDRAP